MRLTVLALLILLVIGLPVGLLHAGGSYAPVLFDDDSMGTSDSISVVVVHASGDVELSLSDSLTQSDALSRQAELSKNTGDQLASNDQVTKNTGHAQPLFDSLNLTESLSEMFQSNDQSWLWAVLLIIIGAAVAGIAGAGVAYSRRKPKPFRNVPRARAA